MKRLSVILLCSVVFLCLVQVGAALTYEGQISTSPTQLNALKPGDIISEVSGTLKLPASGDQTFALDDNLDFYTQLDNAKWSISIVINGVDNPARTFGGKHATILGMDLAYVSTKYDVKVRFSMTDGVVPASFNTGDIILVRALELDSHSDQVGAAVFKNGTVISTAALQTQLDSVKAKLTDLKNLIDEKASKNVDVAVAQQKYNAASSALDSAATKILTSPSEVNALLTSATNNINDANTALDKAEADQSLQQAKTTLASVDGLINEFTVNDSLKTTDSRLVAIINKRDLSAQAISNANDLFTTGSYPSARGKADEGLNLANQAWNLSLSLKTELGQGFSLPGLPNLGAFLPVLIVVVVVAVIAGVIIYRKKTQWDELG
ncbi:MAG: hypothetical protein LUQ60_02935 [Methanomicrobiales archaeon]|nr:hypothetical protein [Methanomicrobiales archaeon]